MIMKKNDLNHEYLYYLMNDIGLLNDYELNEVGISFDEWDNPSEDVLEKLETYRDNKK